ncbi:MAG: SRPBCC family protein [Deltaproteobacteria bacterium]|nr:SRPBCC family protein [Deltaproteobacteria bacterium]
MKNVLFALTLVVGGFAAFVATRPSEFRIERSTTIAAPSEIVFEEIDDFRRWAAWSPWEKMDPAMKREYSGPASGVGATYHWIGNEQVGEGRMTIVESAPARVAIRLEFVTPMKATNDVTLELGPAAGGTDVTWAMTGKNDFMAKAAGLFMDVDAMVGADFERGLADLTKVVEARWAAERAAREAAEAAAAAAVTEAAADAAAPEAPPES